jgi:hypothetical protein
LHTASSCYQPPPHTAKFTSAMQSLGGASSKGNDTVASSLPEPGLCFHPKTAAEKRGGGGGRSLNEPPRRETTPARRRRRRGLHRWPRVSSGPLHPTPATITGPKTPKRPEPVGGRIAELGGTFFIRSGAEVGGLHTAPTPTATSPPRRPR